MTTTPTSERSVSIDLERQEYRVPSCLAEEDTFSVPFAVITEELTAFAPWLYEHGVTLPAAPEPYTLAWYTYWKGVVRLVDGIYLLTGEQHPLHLIPQLMGLEGCRVRVLDNYGEEQTFVVMRTPQAVPYHEYATPSKALHSFAPIVGYPFQEFEMLERDVWTAGERVG